MYYFMMETAVGWGGLCVNLQVFGVVAMSSRGRADLGDFDGRYCDTGF